MIKAFRLKLNVLNDCDIRASPKAKNFFDDEQRLPISFSDR